MAGALRVARVVCFDWRVCFIELSSVVFLWCQG